MSIDIQGAGICMLVPEFGTAGVTSSMVVDTTGYDYLNFSFLMGTSHTAVSRAGTFKWSESDTSTDVTSMTDIVALTGGTATSSSVGWVVPASTNTGQGTVIEFNIDLRKRAKYLGLRYTGGAINGAISGRQIVGGIGHLLRAEQSADTNAEKSTVTRYDNTAASACSVVVTV